MVSVVVESVVTVSVVNKDGVVKSVSALSVEAAVLKNPVVGKGVSVSFAETVVASDGTELSGFCDVVANSKSVLIVSPEVVVDVISDVELLEDSVVKKVDEAVESLVTDSMSNVVLEIGSKVVEGNSGNVTGSEL